ncbi:MAG: aspartate/glutamate racemase family protein [Acetobacteraceae bacterium]
MKLLLVNGNTTQAVTDRVVAEATRCASAGTIVAGATARFGVSIVSTEAEEAVAGHAVLDALAANFAGYDAAILAISFDTALLGARQVVPIPVVGMTEASLLTACLLGRRFGLISFGQSSRGLYLDLVQRAGLAQRMAAFETIDLANSASYLREGGQDAAVIATAERLIEAGADAVVVAGAAMAGIAHRLCNSLSVPLLDGIACAVGQAETLVRLGLRQRAAVAPLTGGSTTSGVDPALSGRLSRQG